MYTLVLVIILTGSSGQPVAISSQQITSAGWTLKGCEKEGKRLAQVFTVIDKNTQTKPIATATWSCTEIQNFE